MSNQCHVFHMKLEKYWLKSGKNSHISLIQHILFSINLKVTSFRVAFAVGYIYRSRLYASIVVTVNSMHLLGLRTTFIMKDNGIKILFCCTFEMDSL